MRIGEIVTEKVPIGTGTNIMRDRRCKVIAAYDKKQLGVMYLLETVRGKFKTCVMVPPPPRFQPDEGTAHRWEKRTNVDNAPAIGYKEIKRYKTYDEMQDALGLDKSIKRSLSRLRSIAEMHGCEVDEDVFLGGK